jgi:hypothetical protein
MLQNLYQPSHWVARKTPVQPVQAVGESGSL